jgi:hypothetical protein
VKNFGGTNEYDDDSETNRSFSSEEIYINDSNEGEIGLYVLEAIPKVGVLFQVNQKV